MLNFTNWNIKQAHDRWIHVCIMIHKSNTTGKPTAELSVEQVEEITAGTGWLFGQSWSFAHLLQRYTQTLQHSHNSITHTRPYGYVNTIDQRVRDWWEMHWSWPKVQIETGLCCQKRYTPVLQASSFCPLFRQKFEVLVAIHSSLSISDWRLIFDLSPIQTGYFSLGEVRWF